MISGGSYSVVKIEQAFCLVTSLSLSLPLLDLSWPSTVINDVNKADAVTISHTGKDIIIVSFHNIECVLQFTGQ